MNIIKEDIKNKSFRPVYLLYGTEEYLKKLYKGKLTDGALGDGDSMNLSFFSGSDTDMTEVCALADTMPFFSEHRVIVLEDTGWFASSNDLTDYLPSMPETTVLIFSEKKTDERNRLMKYVKAHGHAAAMNPLSEDDLLRFVAANLKTAGKKATIQTIKKLFLTVGTDMNVLKNESEKLIAYTGEREIVTEEDIESICTELITNRIFVMIDAVAEKNKSKAISLYFDLLSLREKPLSVLYLLIRHFHILYMVKDMVRRGADNGTIAQAAGVPPFAVKKYAAQAARLSEEVINRYVTLGTDLETDVKTGKLTENVVVELFLCSEM